MKLTADYHVGDLVQLPEMMYAMVMDHETKCLVDYFLGDDPPVVGIVTDIGLDNEYNEVTILVGDEFLYIPNRHEKPKFILVESL
jgi:hypothetical protein